MSESLPQRPSRVAWCPRINAPATACHDDGCTHYLSETSAKLLPSKRGQISGKGKAPPDLKSVLQGQDDMAKRMTREVTARFVVNPDNERMTPFLEMLAWCWERFIATQGESYEIVNDAAEAE